VFDETKWRNSEMAYIAAPIQQAKNPVIAAIPMALTPSGRIDCDAMV